MSKEEITNTVVDEATTVEVETNTEAEEVNERPYTLRRFKDEDLFPMLLILRKIGIKDFKDAFQQKFEDEDEEGLDKATILKKRGITVGLVIADTLIGNLPKCKEEVYALYSDMSGIPVEEMKEMEFGTLPLMIYDSFGGMKNTSFFKVLFKLL